MARSPARGKHRGTYHRVAASSRVSGAPRGFCRVIEVRGTDWHGLALIGVPWHGLAVSVVAYQVCAVPLKNVVFERTHGS